MTTGAPDTIIGLIDTATQRFGSRVALIAQRRFRGKSWTYAELWAASEQACSLLAGRGVEPGERVILWAPNDPLWVIAFLGVLRRGAIVVPLDLRSSPDLVAEVVTQTQPRLAVVASETERTWTQGLPVLPLAAFDRAGRDTNASGAVITPATVAEIVFTSGTTGAPKGVILTHGNVAANVAAVRQLIPPQPGDRLLSLLPLSHMLEQSIGLLLPLSGGGSVVYTARRQSTEVFRALQRHRVTAMVVVPQALDLFYKAIEGEVRKLGRERSWELLLRLVGHLPMPLRRLLFRPLHRKLGGGGLRFLVSGGAPLDPALALRWEALGIPVLQGYGTTEASPVVTGTTLEGRRADSVGKALPGQSVQLAEDGEVLISGPNVTSGYWQNSTATGTSFVGGWYRTGDLGELDQSGYLRLRGRKKDVIVLPSGLNVYAEDVESALRRQPGVRDVAVVGLPASDGAMLIHAVLLGPPSELEAGRMVEAANAQLAEHQRIRGFSVWTEADFPRTTTLKVKKHEIIDRLDGRSEPPPAVAAPGTKSLSARVAEWAQVPVDDVTPAARLGRDLGLDSLARVELLTVIEADLGVEVDETRVLETTTVAELEVLVDQAQPSSRPVMSRWPLARWARGLRTVLQQGVAFPALRLCCPVTAAGLEHLPGLPLPVILVANHASHLDAICVLSALPGWLRRQVSVAAADDYFFSRRWLGATVALLLNAFPFSRTGAIRSTLEQCGELLDEGRSILLFPEGTRTTDGAIGPFRAGIGLMACELEVPVVPVRVRGTFEALPKGRIWPRRHPVQVAFGAALRFEAATPYAEAADAIEAAVRAL